MSSVAPVKVRDWVLDPWCLSELLVLGLKGHPCRHSLGLGDEVDVYDGRHGSLP